MRIARLDLTAFGPFTDLSLDLSAPGLHVVHGPNEAGKSSALAALGALLYGIPNRTTHDFVHAKRDLRLGARIDDGAGTTLELVRHKRNKNPLTDADGTPIGEDALAPLLNGISAEVFTSTFALTLAELKNGGDALLRGEGDLGRALFSAQSSQDLTAVLCELDARQRELYLPSGSKPPLNQGLRRHRDLTNALRDTTTDTDTYVRLRREKERAEARFAEVDAQHREAATHHERLERLRLALPLLRARHSATAEVERLEATGPVAPADAEHRRLDLDRALERSREDRDRTAQALATARDALAEIEVDSRLVLVQENVTALTQAVAGVEKAASTADELERQAAEYRAAADRLLDGLHHDPHGNRPRDEPVAGAVPRVDPSARERVALLTAEYAELGATRRSTEHQVATAERTVERAEAARDALPEVPDPRALSTVLTSVPAELPDALSREYDALATTVASQEAVVAAAGWTEHAVDEVLAATVPTRAEVVAHRERVTEHRGDLKGRRRELRKLTSDRSRVQAELDDLLSRSAPPSPDDLATARGHRDSLWRRIRTAPEPQDDDSASFETAVRAADDLADRLLREADTVARRTTLERRVHTLDQEIHSLEGDIAALEQTGEELERAWTELWPAEPVTAPALDAAEDVLERIRELRALNQERHERDQALAWTQDVARGLAHQLREHLGDCGVNTEPLEERATPAGLAVQLRQLTQYAHDELTRRDAAAEERAEAVRQVASAHEALERAQDAKVEADTELADWTRRWNEATAPIGFPPDSPVDAVRADLDRLSEAADLVERATEAEERAEREHAETARFDQDLRAVFLTCATELPEDRAERSLALESLAQRVRDNAEQDRRREELRTRIADGEAELGEADSARARAEERLAALCAEVGVTGVEELREAIARSERVTHERARLVDAEEKLAQWGDVDAIAAQVGDLTQDEIGERSVEAAAELERVTEARDAAQNAQTEARIAFSQVDSTAEAARIADELTSLEAELVEQTEQYLRLAFAHDLLHQQMEDYRRRNQDPILGRAAEIFAGLTLGRFTRLVPDTDDRGGKILRVTRETGDTAEVPALSEGTRDQLYLALRLASLERYADAGQTMPFVVDDVFMTFDDERSAAALRILDSMAERFQIVVFTHHGHLVDLAHHTLPPDRVHPHPLARFAPTPRTTSP
ncbi:AAA family ATPase [Spiractinospora alimapuensis]|uniref:YhaN family protein n=1 Tax=Spiractinospora alimapuensis TaxID=2820884 RepID=UPI001F28E2B7|nr:YhaN family protein [Spiractinospora alimapuensis]QVQ50886.1 AAA family ATPase [Spiractinospora alimapuensis]